ncbi:MAG: DUF1501 domain-containing protein [Cyclobacteriaceae bacterium]|nr:DUF1501 domain-containing protein [Cyclobacteriaceae bacterium]
MKRRDFLKHIPAAAALPISLGGIPLKAMAWNPLTMLAQQSNSDRVLIILQLHGGNDGLNTLIPIEQYDLYYSRRANIAIPKNNSLRKLIPLDSTLPSDKQVGLHPDMTAIKALYDNGRAAFVQGVSYKNNNGSHFRGRDIWFMGGGADDYYPSGWVGRYLAQEYAALGHYPEDFPHPDMPDPLGIEMGNDVSLIFHQQGNIPTSISLNDPEGFAALVEELEGFQDVEIDPRGRPPAIVNNSPYWHELNWILGLEKKTDDYAQRLYQVYLAGGATSVTYPEIYPFNAPRGIKRNPLTPQLKLVARLLAGGCKTKVFLVRIGGFDTHAEQVENYDPTMGMHAALLYHVSAAMKAFQDDLRARGLEDRVLTVTTSEFGRRIHSNGSYGTDHGTGGPILIFGKHVQPGVVGTNPDLTQDNVEMQYDYRQVYANLLKDWMLVDKNKITNDIFFGNFIDGENPDEPGTFFEPLSLARDTITGNDSFIDARFYLGDCYPNPAKAETFVYIPYRVNATIHVKIELLDAQGRSSKLVQDGVSEPGEHRILANLQGLKPGMYICRMKAGSFERSKKLVIVQ